ncbi:MAG: RNA polymerase sigma factor [Akkermansiaceae bacterium]
MAIDNSDSPEPDSTSEPVQLETARAIAGAAKAQKNTHQASPKTLEWSEWLRENGSRMLLFARQQTRTAEDAEDVLQDALVKLARKVEEGTFDGGQPQWKPYLYTAIRRLSIDLGRKNDRRNRREEKSEADRRGETGGMSDPWFETGASNDETRNLLEENLKKLPPKFSEVIIMKIWGEHTFAQIGEMLGVSLNTVASRYRYGLERLKKSLEPSRIHNDI